MNKEEREIECLRDILDDDPTDELPILTIRGVLPGDSADSLAETGSHQILHRRAGEAAAESPEGALLANSSRSLERLETEIEELQDKWQQVERRLADRDAEVSRLQEALAERAQQVETLEAELAKSTATIASLESARCDLNAELQTGARERQRLLADIAGRDERAADQAGEIARLRTRLAELEAEARDWEALAATRGEEAEQAGAGREELTAAIGRYRERIQDLETYIDGANAQRRELEERLCEQSSMQRALEQAAASWERRSERQAAEIRSLQALLRRAERQSEQLRTDLQYARREQRNSIASLETLRLEKQDLEQRLEGASRQAAELTFTSEQQLKEIAVLKAEIQRLEESATELLATREKLALLEEALGARDEQLHEAEEALAEATDEATALREALEQQTQQLAVLRDELSQQQQQGEELEGALAGQAARVEQLEDELASRDEALAKLGADMQRLDAVESSLQLLEARMQGPVATREPAVEDDPHGEVTRLLIALGEDRAVKYPLYKADMVVGRAPDSDIQIRHQFISRHHARLLSDEQGTFIEDLGSKNGVRVNANRVAERQRLRNGDLVDIGKTRFQFIDLLAPHGNQGTA